MPKKKESVKKSKSSEILSDGMIKKLLNSDNLEDVKLGAKVLENRAIHKKIDKQYQSYKRLEDERKAEYHRAGYGYIVSDEYHIPATTMNQLEKVLNEPTYAEIQDNKHIKLMNQYKVLWGQMMFYIVILGYFVFIV